MAKVDGNLLLLNDFSIPLHLSIQDVYTQLLTLPLGTSITLGDFVNSDFDVFTIFQGQDEGNIELVKNTIRNLVAIIQDDSSFAPILQEYIEGVQSDNGIMYSNMYKNLVYCRHFLRKSLLTVFVGLTIAQESKKEYKNSKKREQLQNLRKLLLDTTKIILNLDVIPTNASVPERMQFGTVNYNALVSQGNSPKGVNSAKNASQEVKPKPKSWADDVEDTEEELRASFDAAEKEFIQAEVALNDANSASKAKDLMGVLDAALQKAQESTEELRMPDLDQRLKALKIRANTVREKFEASMNPVVNSATNSKNARVPKRISFGPNEYNELGNAPRFNPQTTPSRPDKVQPNAKSLAELRAFDGAEAQFTKTFNEAEEELNKIENNIRSGTKTGNVSDVMNNVEVWVKDLDTVIQKARESAKGLSMPDVESRLEAMRQDADAIRGRAANILTKAMSQK